MSSSRRGGSDDRRVVSATAKKVIYEGDWAEIWKLYLTHLARSGNRADAAQKCRLTLRQVRDKRKNDADFREAEDDALRHAAAKIFRKQWDAAMKGDTYAQRWLLERLNPEEYGRQAANVQVNVVGDAAAHLRAILPVAPNLEDLEESAPPVVAPVVDAEVRLVTDPEDES